MRSDTIRDDLIQRLVHAFALQGVGDPQAYLRELRDQVDDIIPKDFTNEQVSGACSRAASDLIRNHKTKWIPAIAEICGALKDAVSAYSSNKVREDGIKWGAAYGPDVIAYWRDRVSYYEGIHNAMREIHGEDHWFTEHSGEDLLAARYCLRWFEVDEATRKTVTFPEKVQKALRRWNPHWGRNVA